MTAINPIIEAAKIDHVQMNINTEKPVTNFKLLLSNIMEDKQIDKNMNQKEIMQQAWVKPTASDNVLLAQNISAQDTGLSITERERKRRRINETPSERLMQELEIDNTLSVTPLQFFSEAAIKALQDISNQEYHVNNLMQEYINGKSTIEEVSIETTKLNLAISFASTVISTASQTFKELISMQI